LAKKGGKSAAAKLVRPPRFDEWLECYFAPYDKVDSPWERFPVGGDEDFPNFKGSDTEIVELFTYTMLTSGTELAKFTAHQVGNGLNVLFNSSLCDVAYRVGHGSTRIEDKIAAIRSMESLYRDCLTPRAPKVLGTLDEKSDCPPLSLICYMLWDVAPLRYWKGVDHAQRLYEAAVDVMAATLLSPNVAVVESGLHGLGHSVYNYEVPAVAAIDRFIETRRGQVREELIAYAKQARTGMIQ
jgi:hypothetical protein